MRASQKKRQLVQALDALENALFACGEWTSDEDQTYDQVHDAATAARKVVNDLLGLGEP